MCSYRFGVRTKGLSNPGVSHRETSPGCNAGMTPPPTNLARLDARTLSLVPVADPLAPGTALARGSRQLAGRLEAKYGDRITGAIHVPGREGTYAPFPADLPPKLADALRARGVAQLYSHQAAAWDATQRGEHVCVLTPTASGKTLCY